MPGVVGAAVPVAVGATGLDAAGGTLPDAAGGTAPEAAGESLPLEAARTLDWVVWVAQPAAASTARQQAVLPADLAEKWTTSVRRMRGPSGSIAPNGVTGTRRDGAAPDPKSPGASDEKAVGPV